MLNVATLSKPVTKRIMKIVAKFISSTITIVPGEKV